MQNDQQPSPNDQAISKFIDGILAAKKVPGLDNEDVRRYVHQDLTERLLDQIDHALISALSEEKAVELNTLLDDDEVTGEKLQQFIVDAGVDVPKVTALAMIRFRDLYLDKVTE